MTERSPFDWFGAPVDPKLNKGEDAGPLNPWFSFHDQGSFRNKNERNLMRGLHKEVISIHGFKVYYIPRSVVKMDFLFGEDYLSKFEKKYELAAYLDNFQGFGPGGPDFITKFGVEIRDEANLVISALHFFEVTGQPGPKDGDLIFFPSGDVLFEIKFVEDELQFYPLSQQMSYKLRCEAFDFSYESIDTDTRADLVEDQSPMVEILSDIDPSTADNFTVEESTDLVLDRSEKNVFGEY